MCFHLSLAGDSRNKDGAFMEPSGRNWWQLVANGEVAKPALPSRNRCSGLRPVADRSARKKGSTAPRMTCAPLAHELAHDD
jgi:hypothetical protein